VGLESIRVRRLRRAAASAADCARRHVVLTRAAHPSDPGRKRPRTPALRLVSGDSVVSPFRPRLRRVRTRSASMATVQGVASGPSPTGSRTGSSSPLRLHDASWVVESRSMGRRRLWTVLARFSAKSAPPLAVIEPRQQPAPARPGAGVSGSPRALPTATRRELARPTRTMLRLPAGAVRPRRPLASATRSQCHTCGRVSRSSRRPYDAADDDLSGVGCATRAGRVRDRSDPAGHPAERVSACGPQLSAVRSSAPWSPIASRRCRGCRRTRCGGPGPVVRSSGSAAFTWPCLADD